MKNSQLQERGQATYLSFCAPPRTLPRSTHPANLCESRHRPGRPIPGSEQRNLEANEQVTTNLGSGKCDDEACRTNSGFSSGNDETRRATSGLERLGDKGNGEEHRQQDSGGWKSTRCRRIQGPRGGDARLGDGRAKSAMADQVPQREGEVVGRSSGTGNGSKWVEGRN
jgi:hypothetical protein